MFDDESKPMKSVNDVCPPSDPVPQHYIGVWQRKVLEQGADLDTASQVYWLQTAHWHADLRIPAGRPDFSGIRDLHECDRAHLDWLATQQGFFGMTEVDGARCHWRRFADFQPDSGHRDVGQMAFNDERLIEVGCEADYLEVWQRLPEGTGGSAVLERAPPAGGQAGRRTWLLVTGSWFAYVRERLDVLPSAASLARLVEETRPPRERLLAWLDFEISLGHREGRQPWRIEHSSLPFREGAILFEHGAPVLTGTQAVEEDTGRCWNVLEWHLDRL